MTSQSTGMNRDGQFREVEHKFLVDERFDVEGFAAAVDQLAPSYKKSLRVLDNYAQLEGHPHLIFRHRFDREIQQLTVKDYGRDNESRLEINLDLTRTAQGDAVLAFLGLFGRPTTHEIVKTLRVFEFPDCEIVYYEASHKDRLVRCVEFEAVSQASEAEAIDVIRRYEAKLGFDMAKRCKVNLFDLLVLGKDGGHAAC